MTRILKSILVMAALGISQGACTTTKAKQIKGEKPVYTLVKKKQSGKKHRVAKKNTNRKNSSPYWFATAADYESPLYKKGKRTRYSSSFE